MNTTNPPVLSVFTVPSLFGEDARKAMHDGLASNIAQAPKGTLVGIILPFTYAVDDQNLFHDVAQYFLVADGVGGLNEVRYHDLPEAARPVAADLAQRVLIVGNALEALGAEVAESLVIHDDKYHAYFTGYVTAHGFVLGDQGEFEAQEFAQDDDTLEWPDLSEHVIGVQTADLSAHQRLQSLPQMQAVAQQFFPLQDCEGNDASYVAQAAP